MPPIAATFAPPVSAGPKNPVAAAPGNAPVCFGPVPITETGMFPPGRAAHCWIYLTLNAEIALSLPENRTLNDLVRHERARISIDGQWLWWALQRKYPGRQLAKLSGSDLIHALAAHCAQHHKRLFLLGSTPEANAQAVMRMRERLPVLSVAGYAPPPYTPGSVEEGHVMGEMYRAVRVYEPDFVVLGLGAAKEQLVSSRLAPLLDGRVTGMLCFGGAIDMASGRVRRAPRWMQYSGLEGLYRVWQQPARLLRLFRVLRVLPMLATGRY